MKKLLLAISLFAVGCTCSNEVDTPRDISKEPHGSIMFINISDAVPDIRCFYGDYETSYRNGQAFVSSYHDEPSTLYNDIPVGGSAIQLKTRTESTILNVPIYFRDGYHYSLILSGSGSDNDAAIFTDDLGGTRNGKVYVRCINFTTDSSDIVLSVDSTTTIDFTSFRKASSFMEIDSLLSTVQIESESGKVEIPIGSKYPFKHISIIMHKEFASKSYSIVRHN